MKKLLCLALAGVMTMSIMVGCGNEEPQSSEPSSSVEGSSEPDPADFTYPVNPPVKLTINYNDYIKVVGEERDDRMICVFDEPTGVIIESNGRPMNSSDSAFLTMLISGELPDILVNNFHTTYVGGPGAAIKEGYIIDLTPYEKYMPNYMAFLEQYPDYKNDVYIDGKLWCVPALSDTNCPGFSEGEMPAGASAGAFHVLYRKDILDELKMDVPTTLDEFYNVLKAVKAAKPEMVPFATEKRWLIDYTTNCKGFDSAFNIADDFYSYDDKTVIWRWADPKTKELYQYFAKLFDEELLTQDLATIAKGDVRGGMALGKYFCVLQQWGDQIASMTANEVEGAEFAMMPYFSKVKGEAPLRRGSKLSPSTGTSDATIGNYNWSISTDCPPEKIEAACRYMDYMFTQDGIRLYNLGKQGLVWDFDENGKVVLVEEWKSDPDNAPENKIYEYAKKTQWVGISSYTYTLTEEWHYEFGKQAVGTSVVGNYRANYTQNQEEKDLVKKYKADVTAYIKENVQLMVTGEKSFDEWETMVETARTTFHGDEITATWQSAMDRTLRPEG
jgi:putative aldouronate transport system substrate-binding protein